MESVLFYQPGLAELECRESVYGSLRAQNLQVPKRLIEEIMLKKVVVVDKEEETSEGLMDIGESITEGDFFIYTA